MKNKDVIEKILSFHPKLAENYSGCDNYKCGNPEEECKGIGVALVPTIDVIEKAGKLGCNLLIVHEPSFYSTPDYPDWRAGFTNEIYVEKRALLDQKGITIWRDHDHMHAHTPDIIFTGVTKYLGWERYVDPAIPKNPYIYRYILPECTVGELLKYLVDRLCLNGMRYIGNWENRINKVAIVGHLMPDAFGLGYVNEHNYFVEYATTVIQELENSVDVIIPGEIVEWTVLSYVRDAVQLGKAKAVLNLGHFNLEELGMKYAADCIRKLIDESCPVVYIPTGDMYCYSM